MKSSLKYICASSLLVFGLIDAHAQGQSGEAQSDSTITHLAASESKATEADDRRAPKVQFDDYDNEKFKAHELSFDFTGSMSFGQDTLENLSANRVEDDERLGAGLGINYFITKAIGIGIDAYTENTQHSFVDNASISLIFRIPIESIGLAPYALGGVGRQMDPVHVDFLQAGAGLEWRFHKHLGVFVDGRYMFLERASDVGLGRFGLRVRF